MESTDLGQALAPRKCVVDHRIHPPAYVSDFSAPVAYLPVSKSLWERLGLFFEYNADMMSNGGRRDLPFPLRDNFDRISDYGKRELCVCVAHHAKLHRLLHKTIGDAHAELYGPDAYADVILHDGGFQPITGKNARRMGVKKSKVNFGHLSAPTLRRYANRFSLEPEASKRNEKKALANCVAKHFTRVQVDELNTIADFIYVCSKTDGTDGKGGPNARGRPRVAGSSLTRK